MDLTGSTYGRLLVLSLGTPTASGLVRWVCKCSCGKIKSVIQGHLRAGHTVSCGCFKVDVQKTASVTHGFSASGKTPEQLAVYRVWAAMKRRCTSPKDKDYEHYGAKGVTVCPEWMDFEAFFADMGYPNGLMLERKDNTLGYSKSNCIWAPRKTQLDNRGVTIWVKMPDGRVQTASDAFRELGCSKSMFFRRIKNPEGFMGVTRVEAQHD